MSSFQPAEHAAAGVVAIALKLDGGKDSYRCGSAFERGATVWPRKPDESAARQLLNGPDWLAQDVIDGITQEHTVDGYTSWPALAVSLETALRLLRAEARKLVPPGQDWEWLEADGIGFYCQLGRDELDPALIGVWIDGAWHFPGDVLAPSLAEKLQDAAEAL